MSAVVAGFQFLQGKLSGDTTLMGYLAGGIHQSKAPIGTPPNYGIIASQAPANVLSGTAKRIYSPNLYLVKFVGPATNNADLTAADNRAFTLLDQVNATVSEGIIMACYQETPFYFTEIVNGVLWIHIGGLYRIQIK